MTRDHISARMTWDTTVPYDHISATTAYVMLLNTFGMSVYSKE
jgi:hypothetical protein